MRDDNYDSKKIFIGSDQDVLEKFNHTEQDYPRESTYISLFKRQAEQTPGAIAVGCNGRTLTYRQLAQHTAVMAGHFQSLGVSEEAIVAVMLDRSIDMMVSILALWQIGSAYVPLDPELPKDRLELMLKEADIRWLISTKKYDNNISTLTSKLLLKTIYIEDYEIQKEKSFTGNSPHILNSDSLNYSNTSPFQLAYVIYTSGSTGVPKGAMVEQRGMVNHMYAKIRQLGLANDCVIAQNATQSFDISVWQFFNALLVGGRTEIFDRECVLNLDTFIDKVADTAVTILEVVPSYLKLLIDYFTDNPGGKRKFHSLRYMVVTGEAVKQAYVNQWFEVFPGVPLVNAYGPTEASDDITHYCITGIEDRDFVPIGAPVQNMKIYIVDEQMRPCPVDQPGEIMVAGEGVGRGYLNNPEKTHYSFIPNSFCNKDEYRRLYRTGDIGQWMPDGNIRFFGRRDHQVKIRGYRIELEEIESRILSYAGIREAVVLDKTDDKQDKYLCCYFVPHKNQTVDTRHLLEYLALHLPDYMQPSVFVKLEKIPLTFNGKVNREALLAIEDHIEQPRGAVPPSTKTQQILYDIWKAVLKPKQEFGITDDFIRLGGNSVLSIQIIARIKRMLKVNIPIRELFEHSTIEELAIHIDQPAAKNQPAASRAGFDIPKRQTLDKYPLAPVQYPEWYLLKLNPESTFYNIGMLVEMTGQLNLYAFHNAVNIVINRHDSLRIHFTEEEGTPYQVLAEHLEINLEDIYINIREIPGKENYLKELVDKFYNTGFKLDRAPIATIKLIHVEDHRYILIFVSNHIIWDQVSTFNFSKELEICYNALVKNQEPGSLLPALTTNYLDYALWMNENTRSGQFRKQQEYWLNKFSTLPPPLDLPTDFPRPPVQTYNGDTLFQPLPLELKQEIEAFCIKFNTTLQIFLLSILDVLIYRLTGQEDFVVGTPIFNRPSEDLEKLIGLFATALPIRCNINGNTSFAAFLEQMKSTSIDAYDNYLYPFNRIIEELHPTVDFSRAKIMSVFFGVQNDETEIGQLKFDGFEVKAVEDKFWDQIHRTSVFDFTLQVDYAESYIVPSLRYNSDLFKESTAAALLNRYIELVKQAVKEPNRLISQYDFLIDSDRAVIAPLVNNPDRFDLADEGLHCRIERKAAENPDLIALFYKDEVYTYGEVDRQANRIAQDLEARGVKKGDRIGVLLPPSPRLIFSLLGILKAGGVYVPLSNQYPPERMKEIDAQAQLKFLLADNGYLRDSNSDNPVSIHFQEKLVNLDNETEAISRSIPPESTDDLSARFYNKTPRSGLSQNQQEEKSNMKHESDTAPNFARSAQFYNKTPRSGAYIIFTSGSTGKPKGIEIRHKSVINMVQSTQAFYNLGENDRFLFHTPAIFDVSLQDIFWSLSVGASLVILEEDKRNNIVQMAQYIDRCRVTIFQTVPLLLDSFIGAKARGDISSLPSLRYVIVGAAIAHKTLRDGFFQHFNAKLVNHYGPTETTVDASRFDCSSDFDTSIVPVGKPIANTDIYILDPSLNLCPVGVPGELYISSAGNAVGYLHNPELTARQFIPNIFNDPFCDKLYKTGDRGLYMPDGNILVTGRLDNQVKVNGNRVEIDDIENNLLASPYIRNAAVILARNETNYEQLAAFVETDETLNTIYPGSTGEKENAGNYRFYTLQQNPTFKKDFDAIHFNAWPVFFWGSKVLKEYWNNLYRAFPQYQFTLVSEEGKVLGIGNSIPICWDGDADHLPCGWDGTIVQGFTDYERQHPVNTLVILAGVIAPGHKGLGLSQYLIDGFRALARYFGMERLVVALRPIGKVDYPELTIDEYCNLVDDDGFCHDKWVKLHQKAGGRILKTEIQSQHVRGSVCQWEEWSGQSIKQSGEIFPKGALQGVKIDLESGQGVYDDPAVWISHSLESPHLDKWRHIDEFYLKEFLRKKLPAYMVPDKFVVLHRIPRLEAGKNDKSKLEQLEYQVAYKTKVPPSTQNQVRLQSIFHEVLQCPCEDIGIHDNFFQLGGHSINVLHLLGKIRAAYGLDIRVADIFTMPTIAEIAGYIEAKHV